MFAPNVRRTTAVSQSEAPYMDPAAIYLFAMVAGSITVMVGLIHFISVYFAVPLFLLLYMRMLGNHSWVSTCSITVVAPIVTFLFRDRAAITLPKGYAEPLFYPLYDMFL